MTDPAVIATLLRAALGVLLLLGVAALGIVVPARRGLSATRIVVGAVGIAVGGVVGVAPGAYLLVGRVVVASTGTGASGSWETLHVIALGGVVVGAVLGLVLAELLAKKLRAENASLAGAVAGALVGCLTVAGGVTLVQQSAFEILGALLMPPAFIGATLAGYALLGSRTGV